jgi:four helix bundle protein
LGLSKADAVGQVLGKQVLRSGTSVGANNREASRARSKAEFIAKIGDCLREIDETEYWLELIVEGGCVPSSKMAELLDETRQLIAIFHEHQQARERRVTLRPLAFSFQPSQSRITPG